MTKTNKIPTVKLIYRAKIDARRNISIWLWIFIGLLIGLIPYIKIPLLILGCLLVYFLTPKINLSTPELIQRYSEHPALYTKHYRYRVKLIRLFNIFFGWVCGLIILSFL